MSGRIVAVVVMGLVGVAGCQKEEAPPPPVAAAPAQREGTSAQRPIETTPEPSADAGAAAAAVGAGTIQGVVKLLGTPPEMPVLKRASDPACRKGGAERDESVLVNDGLLRNVVVRVTAVPDAAKRPAPTEPVVVDQVGCTYTPRVQAAVLGQPIQVLNSDRTLHNVHAYEGKSTLFNRAQPAGAPPIKAEAKNGIIKLKCDVHPWMTAYIVTTPHGFFDLTGEDGAFEISGLPPGDYTLEAWHERYGTKSIPISVKADGPAKAEFTFAATERG